MTRYREIMRLHSLGQPNKAIAIATGCSASTVGRVLAAAEEVGLAWPLPDELGDTAIRRIIYPDRYEKTCRFAEPDYQLVHDQLKRKGVTRALLYEEYCDRCRSAGEKPCSVTTFNRGYADWASSLNLTMHIERKPGQKMEVD